MSLTLELEELREQIVVEERRAGLRADGRVTNDEIQRRRLQIALVALVVLAGLLFTTMANDVWQSFRRQSWIDAGAARTALVVFSLGFAVYVYDKEQHLKRLSSLGRHGERIDLELGARLLRAGAIAAAVEDVTGALELDDVVNRVLNQAMTLTATTAGTLHLVDGDGELRLATVALDLDGNAGDPRAQGLTVAQEVARTRGAQLTIRDRSALLAVPLIHAGRLLGVVAVLGANRDDLDAGDLEVLRHFARSAANAIGHAQRYEAAVYLLDLASRRSA